MPLETGRWEGRESFQGHGPTTHGSWEKREESGAGPPRCIHSFRSARRKTETHSERISLTACFARCYFIRPFCPSGRRRTHFGKSAAHGSHKNQLARCYLFLNQARVGDLR